MTDEQRPNLSLGQPPGDLKNRLRPLPRGWMWLVVLLEAAAIGLLIALWLRTPGVPAAQSQGSAAPARDVDGLRQVALALEERGLSTQAAKAWEDYLAAAPDASERAEVLYRAGKLYFDAGQYDQAAAALVRADAAVAENQQLKGQIGRKLIESLRRTGHYSEVDRELSRQVKLGGASEDARVLATLSGEKLTEADLDRNIERRVDNMLAMQGAAGDSAARESLLKQLSEPSARRQMLHELLQTEMFCRRARELKLDQHEDYLRARDDMARSLLAARFLADELKKIQPTQVDLESYFQAHRDDYRVPAAISVVAFALAKDEDAELLLKKITSADDFRKLAAERKADAPRQIVQGRPDPQLGSADELFALDEGQWTKTPYQSGDRQWLVLVDKKIPERTPELAEAGDRVRADYVARKQQELSEQLMRDLMTRYDVKIMPPGGNEKPDTETKPRK